MSRRVLVLRPQPGADETARRARAMDLDPAVSPLFEVRPLDWRPPDPAGFDAVMLTSAHAARLAGVAMTPFLGLPCYAVGEATAAAARAAGFRNVLIGPTDGAALVAAMVKDGVSAAFHPCGRERIRLDPGTLGVLSVPVYAAEAAERLPAGAERALAEGAVVLLHSPRAAATFARLAAEWRGEARIVAISAAAAAAAGEGWRALAVAAAPRDEALLEVAAKLCQSEGA